MASNRNADRISPAAVTGGAGFAFEDLVGGWFAAALLAGASPLGPRFGPVSTIRFQANRPLDDIVITSASEPARVWAASIKRFDMLTGGSLHDGFVQSAWQELAASDFDDSDHFVGLAGGPSATGNRNSLQKLIAAASADTPEGLANRVAIPGAFNSLDRTIWNSAKPNPVPDGVDRGPVDALPAVLLERLIPLSLDLEQPDSANLAQALQWCLEALAPGQQLNPVDLWTAVCRRVATVRPTGGSLDWPSLLRALPQFAFALRPDIAPDWQALEQHTDTSLGSVRDDLGNGLSLPRVGARQVLDSLDPNVSLAFLTGPSGCGKTALAKSWVTEQGFRGLWLDAQDLERGVTGLNERLGLRLGVTEAMRLSESPLRIVIDGLDRNVLSPQFAAAAHLARTGADSAHVQVLITTQQLALERVGLQLIEHNAPHRPATLSIGNFDQPDMVEVLAARPQLARVTYEGQLQGVLRRPKLLQVVLDALDATVDGLGAIGDETDVADLWWRHLARGREHQTARGELLIGFATSQADALLDRTPTGGLGELAAYADAVDPLRSDGILSQSDRHYAFSHDLFGDWARYESLLGHTDPVQVLGTKSNVPPWHRAIRLYALSVLQRYGIDAWRDQHNRLHDGGAQLAADLYLDAPLFAATVDAALEDLWTTLTADHGRILNRFLGRFLHIATTPDPQGDLIFPDAPELAAQWAASSRVPIGTLWLPVLRLLDAHADEAVTLAPVQVADTALLWLRRTSRDWPMREQVADIAVLLGRSLIDGELNNAYFADDADQTLWQAVLAAGSEQPDAVSELCNALLASDREASADGDVE